MTHKLEAQLIPSIGVSHGKNLALLFGISPIRSAGYGISFFSPCYGKMSLYKEGNYTVVVFFVP